MILDTRHRHLQILPSKSEARSSLDPPAETGIDICIDPLGCLDRPSRKQHTFLFLIE